MSPQVVLIFGTFAGILAFGLGVFITYKKFKQTKYYLETQVINAEKELELDLIDITEMELLITQAGRELNLLLLQQDTRLNKDRYTITDRLDTKETVQRIKMKKQEKSRDELLAEIRELRKTRVVSSTTEIIVALIRYGTIAFATYFFFSFILDSSAADNIKLAVVLFGTGGIVYGVIERRQRQKMIEKQQQRIKELMTRIDAGSPSSNISEIGAANSIRHE